MTTVAAINSMGGCAHNPRGNLWFNDESTFGHKLLMKMGWSKGKGLGKNEDGIKENLSVKFRNTNSGLGYKDDAYANVMKTEYEAILKNLSANYPQKGSLSDEKSSAKQQNESSEQMSKVVKSKMRYPKLFFGKDVTKYSENDMKSIFICSLPSKDNQQEKPEDSVPSEKQESEVEFPPKEDQTYSSSLSISDYFAKKMKEKKSNELSEAASDSSSQQHTTLDSEIDQTNNSSKKVSKKKENNSEINTNQEFNNDSEMQQTELGFEVVGKTDNLSRKKSSSKRKRKRTELNMNEINTDSPQNSTETECVVSTNKKKRKLQENIASGEKVSKIEIHEKGETSNNNSSISSKKKRKFRINENSSANIITNEADGGKISCQIELSSEKALQLKKKRKLWDEKNNCISNDTHKLSADNSEISNNLPSSVSVKKDLDNNSVVCSKKKKKRSKKIKFKKLKSCLKSKAASYSLKNVSFNENVSFRVIDTDYEFVECLSDASSILQADITEIDEVNSVNENESESGASIPDTQTTNSDDPKCNNDSAAVGEVRVLKESYSLSSLPSPKSDHYNSWIESQRQALKMKMYKSMLKSLKKHKILKSSNLLSIKGYGNWIF